MTARPSLHVSKYLTLEKDALVEKVWPKGTFTPYR
jgi:hypothetical protein